MKKVFLAFFLIAVIFIGVACGADEALTKSLWQNIYEGVSKEFLPTLKNQLFPLLFDLLQALIMTVTFAVITFIASWLKSKTDISKIDNEIAAGEIMLKTMLIESLNSARYKELKTRYTKGEISASEFAAKAALEFKDPILNTIENKTTALGKTLIELATAKFGDGKKFFSGKLEEFLEELKKK